MDWGYRPLHCGYSFRTLKYWGLQHLTSTGHYPQGVCWDLICIIYNCVLSLHDGIQFGQAWVLASGSAHTIIPSWFLAWLTHYFDNTCTMNIGFYLLLRFCFGKSLFLFWSTRFRTTQYNTHFSGKNSNLRKTQNWAV